MRDPKSHMFANAVAMLKQAEQLHRQFFGPSGDTCTASWEPPVDILETSNELCVITALPGVPPDKIWAEIEGTTLIVIGVRPMPTQERRAKIVRLELPYGRFERRITIPGDVTLIDQHLEHGCLTLTFAKAKP